VPTNLWEWGNVLLLSELMEYDDHKRLDRSYHVGSSRGGAAASTTAAANNHSGGPPPEGTTQIRQGCMDTALLGVDEFE
jgi:hypothetical protein